jgi:transposase
MWTTDNRAKYDRDKLRYPSDLTDAEWTLVEPLIPSAKHGGRDREVDVREVVNGIMYVLSTGCQWRYIPKDLPPKSTLHDYLVRWNDDNTLTAIHHALYLQCRDNNAARAKPDRVCDRQPEREKRRKGRPPH